MTWWEDSKSDLFSWNRITFDPPFGRKTVKFEGNRQSDHFLTVFRPRGIKYYPISIKRPDLESSHQGGPFRHLTWWGQKIFFGLYMGLKKNRGERAKRYSSNQKTFFSKVTCFSSINPILTIALLSGHFGFRRPTLLWSRACHRKGPHKGHGHFDANSRYKHKYIIFFKFDRYPPPSGGAKFFGPIIKSEKKFGSTTIFGA